MKPKSFIRAAIFTALLLLIPLIGMKVSSEWNWTASDFVLMGILLFATGSAFEFLLSRGSNLAYKIGSLGAIGTAFFLIWVNLAVGIIGDDNPANILYFGVLLVELIGVIAARFQAQGMSKAMFACAIAQMLVPAIAIFIWTPQEYSWSPGVLLVFALNAFFATSWVASGLLFRIAKKVEAKSHLG